MSQRSATDIDRVFGVPFVICEGSAFWFGKPDGMGMRLAAFERELGMLLSV